MRQKVIAGNWKMNKNLPESVALISEIKNGLAKKANNNLVIVCPPFTSLDTANTLLKGSKIKLGAQNMHHKENGAFTGEISAQMLKSVGCDYVIIGHSERRTIFHENNEMINLKLKQAIKNSLNAIFCVGETLAEREKEITSNVINEQVVKGLEGIPGENLSNILIAYEPVWAIGTGKTATPQQAQEVHFFIRSLIKSLYSAELSEKVSILYGGSVKPDNSHELLSQSDIDGALVGGACLIADSFLDIIFST